MSVTITYNGYALPIQLGKINFHREYARCTFSTEFAIAPSGVAAAMDTLKIWDQTFSIVTSNWSESFSITTNAVAIRSNVDKAGTTLDSRGRQRLRLTIIVELYADRAGDSGFREWSASCDTNEQGRRVVTVEGVVTGTNGATAKANFDSGIATRENAFLTLYGGTYEAPATVHNGLDRNNNILHFRRTHAELLEVYNRTTSGGTDQRNTDLLFVSWNIQRATVNERGSADPGVRYYRVSWGARLKSGVSSPISALETELVAIVIKRLKSQFSETGTLAIVGEDTINYTSTQQEAAASWVFRVAQSPTVSYREVLSAPFQLATTEKVMDGQDHTVEMHSAGALMEVHQDVTHVMEGALPPTPPPPVIAGDFAEGTELVLKSAVPSYTIDYIGRTLGHGDNASQQVVQHTLSWQAVWQVRKPPSNTPLRREVSGLKGDKGRAFALFGAGS